MVDNAWIHKKEEFLRIYNEKNTIVKYLPVYTPFLNHIEIYLVREIIGKIAHNTKLKKKLIVAIKTNSLNIKIKYCAGYFRNMMRCIEKCHN